MTDDEWAQQRSRAILAAFETGRPVFADSDGELHYADGDREPLPDDVGVAERTIPGATVQLTWWARMKRWFGGRS